MYARPALALRALSINICHFMLIHGLGSYSIVRAPLKYAGAVLRRRPTVCPQRAWLETDPAFLGLRLKWNHPQMESTVFKPDWAIFDRKVEKVYYSTAGKDPKKALAYAIGDSKMCQKWKSAWIHRSLADGYIDRNPAPTTSGKPLQKTHDVEVQRLRPLEQLATYCRYGETRYGFIITQEEVVAFRIRRLDPSLIASVVAFDKTCAGIEYKSIRWHASGSGQLTANLAIWALGCMGMNDHHRIMETSDREPLASMVRLTKWTHDEKNKLYRNDISGREISEEDWEKLGDEVAFVKLDKQGGASYTSTFTTGGGVTSITQGIQAINLNTTMSSTRSRKPAQGAAQQPKSAGQGSASSSKPQPAGQGNASASKPKPVGQVAAPSIKLELSAQSAASSSQAQPAGQAAASPSKPTPGTTSPPKKYTIAGKKAAPA